MAWPSATGTVERSLLSPRKPAGSQVRHNDDGRLLSENHRLPRLGSYRERIEGTLREVGSMDDGEVLGALKDLRHRPEGTDRLLAEQVLLARYAELDPETALTYVEGLSGLGHELGQLTVMSAWAAGDPELAGAYFSEENEHFGILDEESRAVAAAVASEWAAQDVEGALDWVATLAPDQQGEAYRRMASDAVVADPDRAMALVESMPDGVDRREMAEAMAGQWALEDPAAASDWLSSLPASDQASAMPSTLKAWMRTDPRGVSEWLADAPESLAKDRAILAMTESPTLWRDPQAAVAWSTVIQDPDTRSQALEKTLMRWQRSDPESLERWLTPSVS